MLPDPDPADGPNPAELLAQLSRAFPAGDFLRAALLLSAKERPAGDAAKVPLPSAEVRYRALLEQLPAVTFMAPLDGSISEMYVSPQIEELLGFSAREWLDEPFLWYRQIHPDDRDRWTEQFARTCFSGERFRAEFRFIARNGRSVWVHAEAKLVDDDRGVPAFLHGVAFDITERKQAEEALQRAHDELEQRVRERTAVAEQRAQELERSNAALEEFAGVTAHELKDPLRAMTSFTQLLARRFRGKLDDQADEFFDRVVNAGTRMKNLINALLDYARVGRAGRPEPVCWADVYSAACELLHAPLQEGGAVILPGFPDALRVLGVEPELVLLLRNLIGNGIKFRGERPAEVRVGAERIDGAWRLHVRDNGIGIAERDLGKLFRMGPEGRLHTRSEYPGHGIGLATCKKIVERHGGRIWIESEPDRGDAFFTLPEVP